MTTRLVVGRVSRTDGTPWRNAKVSFRRCQGTYTPISQFPPDTVIAHTNQDGDLYSVMGDVLISGVYLWCNGEGAEYTPYECQLPKDSFDFKLPTGSSPITLSELREGSGESSKPQYESILEYIDSRIVGVQAGSTQVFSNDFIAATNLSALRVVNLKSRTYANNSNINDSTGTFGLTTSAVNQGVVTRVLTYGEISDNSFNFTPGYLFLTDNGNIVQTVSNSQLFILNIGVAIYSNKIKIDFQEVTICI